MGVTFVSAGVVVVVIVFFVTVMIVVLVMVVVVEGHVERGVFGVDFSVICVFFFISKFDVFDWAFSKCFAQIGDEDAFVIEGFLAGWHGVDFDGCRCVITQRSEG